jgi:hypothetical protein
MDPIRLSESPKWTVASLFQREIEVPCAVAEESNIRIERSGSLGSESKDVAEPNVVYQIRDRGFCVRESIVA